MDTQETRKDYPILCLKFSFTGNRELFKTDIVYLMSLHQIDYLVCKSVSGGAVCNIGTLYLKTNENSLAIQCNLTQQPLYLLVLVEPLAACSLQIVDFLFTPNHASFMCPSDPKLCLVNSKEDL